MWCTGKLSHDKRGAGSIIGAVFILLIIMSGFTFYTLNINVTEDYTTTLKDMQELDFRKNKESIEFKSVSKTSGDKLNITVKNTGSYQIHLIWLGIFNETATPDTQDYYELDVYADPDDTVTNIGSSVTISAGHLRIQLVTKLGNTFGTSYPEEETGYNFVDEEGDPPTIGSHSLFSAQQAGPDGIVDTLTEENIVGSYTELWSDTFKPTAAATWENKSLDSYGVPANSVAIVHIYQDESANAKKDGGVRAVGSSLNRYIPMHEAEAGGLVIVSMMVQVNANESIEIYAETIADNTISFRVIGYFTGTTYTEKFENWNPDYDSSWTDKDLYTDYGVPKGSVAEIFVANADTGAQRNVGVRTDGSSLDRYVSIHESEGGGQDGFTMGVKTDANTGKIECYNTGTTGNFYLLGYFDSNIDYVERMDSLDAASADVWEDETLPTPANAVVEVLVENDADGRERYGGARANSSSLDRRVLIHEGESGGLTGGRWSVQSDVSSTIEIYEDRTQDIKFSLVGYWILENYQLNLEVQWTTAEYDEANEWLSIYGGTMGSEDILVDVWNGTAWNNVFTDLSSGWNSVDVSSYLTSSTFTIRFRSIGDATQADEWEIDATFLHAWT
ncbi:MAG: hypothetical protein NWE91_00410 [Candidatus Bathyarchaeota archaeon]|nr:hypothetical protein [Candidatus Bathyarchaeota archaeon]